VSARDDLLQAGLEANWGIQLQLAWTHAFLKNLDLTAARTLAVQFRFTFSPIQALAELALLLPLIDQTYPPGSFKSWLCEVVAADALLSD
jgi:hypothetical protein